MNILIVEDEELILEEIKDIVSRFHESLDITTSSDPLVALELSEVTAFAIALLDIEMPHIRGIELAEKLYQKNPHIKVAFVTAYNNYAAEAFDLYAIDYVLKPVREERLHACLKRLVEAANAVEKEVPVRIKVKAFGNLQVWVDGTLVVWKRKKAYEVFAYLLTNHDKAMRKEKLIDELFPEFDLERGTVHLQTIISHIRKLGLPISYFDNAYLYSTCETGYDVEEFTRYAEDYAQKGQSLDIEKALAMYKLYTAPFLEEDGFSWSISDALLLENMYLELLNSLLESDEIISDHVLYKEIAHKKESLEIIN